MAAKKQAVKRAPHERAYGWRHGFPAPNGVNAGDVVAYLEGDQESWSPERQLDQSKEKNHPLHRHLWGRPASYWAKRARIDECRKILNGISITIIRKEKEITVRAFEYVKKEWHRVEDIAKNPDLDRAHQIEILKQLDRLKIKLEQYFKIRDIFTEK